LWESAAATPESASLRKVAGMTAPVAVVNFMQDLAWEWAKIAAGGVNE
jgi:hypothetical protein